MEAQSTTRLKIGVRGLRSRRVEGSAPALPVGADR